MHHDPDPIRQLRRLTGGLRLGLPAPTLRQRTLAEVRAALARREERPWWSAWRLEAALGAAIAACVLLLPVVLGPGADPSASSPAAAEPLGLEGLDDLDDLESYLRWRQALARRFPEPERGFDHAKFRTFDLDPS